MGFTRRSFVKSSSYSAGAIALLSAGVALADEASSGKKRTTSEVTSDGYINRITNQAQRKVKTDANNYKWVNQGEPYIEFDDSGDADNPPPEVPDAPTGFPVPVGWKEDPNDVATNNLTAGGSNTIIQWDPDEGGETSITNVGEGDLEEGEEWTDQVRTKKIITKVNYTMTYIFANM